MMQVDHSGGSNWNCGVLIYGCEFGADCFIAVISCLLAALMLGTGWWRVPFRQTRSVILYRPRHSGK